ncbi:MAG: hypothetical protein J5732_02790 [Bacteroidaceae bacterium]|nr:hypothetical protein [Bacteroidaceae bacterium]
MSNDKKKLTSCIGHYLIGILLALLGRNPYRKELDRAKTELAKAMENVQSLKEEYDQMLTEFGKSKRLVTRLERQVESLKAQHGLKREQK